MKSLRYSLLSDGSSDRALTHVLTWLLNQIVPAWAVQATWADLRQLPRPPKSLPNKIVQAVGLYPCDVLFVHRDAESTSYEQRLAEIVDALGRAASDETEIPLHVCVVPVRMQEAWLLLDERAIRGAAGNPNGRKALRLPKLSQLEDLPDPKTTLRELLLEASELSGRRLKQFRRKVRPSRVAEFIEDYAPLRKLPAFQRLEEQTREVLQSYDA
ncbi:MAG: DUF4276 family protein [Phycisphaerae bacterium]|nr:DUF4276 family protein [Phycisphaerae bacterium]